MNALNFPSVDSALAGLPLVSDRSPARVRLPVRGMSSTLSLTLLTLRESRRSGRWESAVLTSLASLTAVGLTFSGWAVSSAATQWSVFEDLVRTLIQ